MSLTRHELERWLCGGASGGPTMATIAAMLGVQADEVGPPSLLAARFTVAVLRDTFTDDRDVRRWLREPRPELSGLAAVDALLWAGRLADVEALAIRAWQRPDEGQRERDAQRRAASASRSPSATNSAPVARSSAFAARSLRRSRPAAPLAPSPTARFTSVPVVLKIRPSAST
jgi:hypothetical protein